MKILYMSIIMYCTKFNTGSVLCAIQNQCKFIKSTRQTDVVDKFVIICSFRNPVHSYQSAILGSIYKKHQCLHSILISFSWYVNHTFIIIKIIYMVLKRRTDYCSGLNSQTSTSYIFRKSSIPLIWYKRRVVKTDMKTRQTFYLPMFLLLLLFILFTSAYNRVIA